MRLSPTLVLVWLIIFLRSLSVIAGEPLILEQMRHRHKVASSVLDLTTQVKIDAWTRRDSLKSSIVITTDISDFEKKLAPIIVYSIGKDNLGFIYENTKFDVAISKARVIPSEGGAVINFKGSLFAERMEEGFLTYIIEFFKGKGRQKIFDEGLSFNVPILIDLSADKKIIINFSKVRVEVLGDVKQISKILSYLPADIDIVKAISEYINRRPIPSIAFPYAPEMVSYGLAINSITLRKERGILKAETIGEMQVPAALISAWAQSALNTYMAEDKKIKVKVILPNQQN